MCKTNYSSNDCEWRLLNVIWSSLTSPSSFIINFEQVYYEIFLVRNISLFVPVVDNTFL